MLSLLRAHSMTTLLVQRRKWETHTHIHIAFVTIAVQCNVHYIFWDTMKKISVLFYREILLRENSISKDYLMHMLFQGFPIELILKSWNLTMNMQTLFGISKWSILKLQTLNLGVLSALLLPLCIPGIIPFSINGNPTEIWDFSRTMANVTLKQIVVSRRLKAVFI